MQVLKTLNNRYQLISVIKRGGFGTIYKGRDNVLAKDIAVKEINRDLLKDEWYVEQFQNEARHVAKMNHQNIVHIFDLVQDEDGQFYIVMEFIDGLDLSTLLSSGEDGSSVIPQHLAVHIVAEICKALDYAHNCSSTDSHEPLNLVHQDISPSNIMLARNGVVKLIDFGIAGVQKQTADDEDSVVLQGKIQYMSPEHVDSNKQLDRRSDIFSLGLVLYELLEGKRFFRNDDQRAIVETLRNGKLKLKDFSRTPKPMQQVIGKALEKSLDSRYQNANQFYIDLVTYLVLNCDSNTIDRELGQMVGAFIQPAQSESDSAAGASYDSPESPSASDRVAETLDTPRDDSGTSATSFEPKVSAVEADEDRVITEELPALQDFDKESLTEKPPEYADAEDEVNTVIDVLRLATRDGVGLKRTLLGSGILIALFLLLDIAFQWTSLGAGVYDFILPPAIKIESVPQGAVVYLNGEQVDGETPLSVDEIDPGNYELRLELGNFTPIVKSLHIPSKGQVQLQGEKIRSGSKPYAFRFRTTLDIMSDPPGAEVYLNDIQYGQTTPCSVTWEIGDRCEIKLTKAGFSDLDGFVIESDEMVEQIEDRRLWSLSRTEKPSVSFAVKGTFGKYVVINSNPPNAAIFLDKSKKSIGFTGNQRLFLSAARHKIVLRKQGYNSRTISLTVDDKTDKNIYASLTRKVRFKAYDATNGKSRDLKATVKKLVRGRKTVLSGRQTPFVVNLQPQDYYAVFSKPGYKDVRVKISASDKVVTAHLQPDAGLYSVIILDDISHSPLDNVEVRFKPLDKASRGNERFDITDGQGTISGSLVPGLYLVRTSKNGYEYQEQSVMIAGANMNLIEFSLARK